MGQEERKYKRTRDRLSASQWKGREEELPEKSTVYGYTDEDCAIGYAYQYWPLRASGRRERVRCWRVHANRSKTGATASLRGLRVRTDPETGTSGRLCELCLEADATIIQV